MWISSQTFFIKNLEVVFNNVIFAIHKQAIGTRLYFYTGRLFFRKQTNNYMTQTLLQLLKDAEIIFARLGEFEASPESLPEVLELIDHYEPPASWILELPSQIREGTYKTIPIDVMEASVRRIFGYKSGIADISAQNPIQDKSGKFSSLVVVGYNLEGDFGRHYIKGVATVTSPNIQGLELAVPKASSMAVKNAIKQLGGLFGKYLNREEEENIVVVEQVSVQEKIESLPDEIRKVQTLEDLKTFHKLVYSKSISHEVQAVYEQRFRELKGK
jgi:hypothetical protein